MVQSRGFHGVLPRRHRRDVSVGDHIHKDWRQPMARFTW